MTNLSRANDAALTFLETLERRRRRGGRRPAVPACAPSDSSPVPAPGALSEQRRAALAAACDGASSPGGYVYFVKVLGEDFVKIGTSTNPQDRLGSLIAGSHRALAIWKVISGDKAVEKAWHKKWSHLRRNGEWFELSTALRKAIAAAPPAPDCLHLQHPDSSPEWERRCYAASLRARELQP
jgi:hypothetical protein